MQIVVPMAGAGRRFAEAGWNLPKPLIPVGGRPMVVAAVSDLPPADRRVFICLAEHVEGHGVDRVLQKWFPECRIVVTSGLTEGQACSVKLAAPHLDLAQEVLVAACDNTHLYSREKLAGLMRDPQVDSLVWTYRHDPRVLARPAAHGWVETDDAGWIRRVSVKVPLSAGPMEDHAVSGCFWFRSGSLMMNAIDAMIAAGDRVNNEYYLDSAINALLRLGGRGRVFEVDKYIGWGTPTDLDDYQRWEAYFAQQRYPVQ